MSKNHFSKCAFLSFPKLCSLAIASFIFLAPNAVGAQTAQKVSEKAEDANETEDSASLDRMLVTAQKREQSIQDIPFSVATLGGDSLAAIQSAGSDIRDLAARVPSLNVEGSNGNIMPRFYIRGLGNTDFDLNASQPVAIVVDEVVQENILLKSQMLFDLERIEVLRGPQGTLFGRNTPAGIVKFESRKPTQETQGYVTGSYGRFDATEFEAAYGGALIDNVLSFRIAGRYQAQDDYIDNLFEGAPVDNKESGRLTDFGGRFQLLYTPNQRFSVLFGFHTRVFEGDSELFRANIIEPGGGLTDELERDEVFFDGRNSQGLDLRGAKLNLEYDTGPVSIISITGFENAEKEPGGGDIDGGFGAVFLGEGNFGPGIIPFPSESGSEVPDLDQWTQELRIASNEIGIVDFQTGFFYFEDDLNITNFGFDSLNNNVLNILARQRQQTEAWAIFGSLDIALTDRLTLAGGIRYTEEEKDFEAERTLTAFGGENLPLQQRSSEDEEISWDASLSYSITPEVTVYTRAAKGFRAPSFQGRVSFGNAITFADTEEIRSFEAGFKSTLLDRRLQVNAAGYGYDMDNQQLTAVGGDINIARLINAEDTDGAGAEMDLTWIVNPNLILTGGFSYNFTEINDPRASTPVPGGFIAVCPEACTINDPVVDAEGNPIGDRGFASGDRILIDGNRLPQAPRWIANWTARYSIPLAHGREAYFFTDWALNTRENFFLFDSPEFSSETVVTGGARLGMTFKNGRYDLAVFGRNVTDETALEGAIDFNNLSGFLNDPPRWGVELSTRF